MSQESVESVLRVAFALYAGRLKDDVRADGASTQGLARSSRMICSGKALSKRLTGLPQMIPLALESCPAKAALISSSVKEPPYRTRTSSRVWALKPSGQRSGGPFGSACAADAVEPSRTAHVAATNP